MTRCPVHPDAVIGYTDPTGGDPELGGSVLVPICTVCLREVPQDPPTGGSS